jgi:NAD-dependent dihydropyrimidine dehydrogenase PreA subunit
MSQLSVTSRRYGSVIEIRVDDNACNGCGLCVKDCPMHVYELRESLSVPVHPENCMGCLSCHEICPAQALEHKGVYPSRRHYIDIRVCEMLNRVI